ncbi:MAG TPA: 8-oxo-dGTP diphosphatase MutT [Rhodospirillaceae bacterium]|nr:MAG: hypothetical protein A2018_01110 [Alphaproteobacteria bacterium GWF2_58_20]HAU29757.1 8-oxo-dGTP diphosphatase MutT [Rhodospirillaceae bacterium]
MPTHLLIVVAIALFNEKNEILMAQRLPGKVCENLWEFPGGKVDSGETPETALVREIREELGITVSEADLFPISFITQDYTKEINRHVLMPLFGCHKWQGEMQPIAVKDFRWVPIHDILTLDLVPADIALVKHIQKLHAL